MAVSYLGRNDLAHVHPAHDEDLGGGERETQGDAPKEMVQAMSRVTSNGFVRGHMPRLNVLRGGAATAMALAQDHEHHEHEAETAFSVTLDEISTSVMEAVGVAAGNPVGEAVTVLGNRISQASSDAAEKSGRAREMQAKRAAEARMKGYEGDACGQCGNFTLVRNGTCMKCNTCGGTSGCS
jgi:ribonucleoside-diphosphate reductase alpha chain